MSNYQSNLTTFSLSVNTFFIFISKKHLICYTKEQKILLLSFLSGIGFVIAELIYAVYSHSQSTLMDALYDASELIFIVLILFLTPLFHMPVSEKHPYGFFQVESFFILIKNIMLTSVTASVLVNVIDHLLSGGNPVDKGQISLFQFILGLASLFILLLMKFMSRKISSPTITAEILGWKIDVAYSLGMSIAFFLAQKLQETPLAFLSPYFDQIVAIVIMILMIPESIRMLLETFRELFLFSPDQQTVDQIKETSGIILKNYSFDPVFYDISRTGRQLWIAIYFRTEEDTLRVCEIQKANTELNLQLSQIFPNSSCELILDTRNLPQKSACG